MKNLKDAKGISLASVLVTVIVVIIVLTSIVYSNNRTKEIQQAMLLNSDIEQLSKKVEIYYLEKQTLPIDETDKYVYKEDLNKDGVNDQEEPKYYRIQLSLLDNLNLNNKEIIDADTSGTLTDEDIQWYVINKETHTIYFAQNEGGNVVIKEAKYDEAYNSILSAATEKGIEFNKIVSESTPAVGNTTIAAGIDSVLGDTSSFLPSTDVELGTNKTPNIQGADGDKYVQDCYKYVGYSDADGWTQPGDVSSSLVLHYDGEFNTFSTSAKLATHNSSAKTWYDLSGNNNVGRIVDATQTYFGYESELSTGKVTCLDNRELYSIIRDTNSTWNLKTGLNFASNEYLYCGFVQNNGAGEATYSSNCLKNGESFTIELVRYSDSDDDVDCAIDTGYYMGILTNGEGQRSKYSFEYILNNTKTTNMSSTSWTDCCTIDKNNGHENSDLAHEHADSLGKALEATYSGFNSIVKVSYENIYYKLFNETPKIDIKFEYQTGNPDSEEVKTGIFSKKTKYNKEYRVIYTSDTSDSTSKRLVWLGTKKLNLYGVMGDLNNGSFIAENVLNQKTINTVTITYDSENSVLKLYYNGTHYGSEDNFQFDLIVPEIALGADPVYKIDGKYTADNLKYQFKYTRSALGGHVYALRIYNKALTPEQIKHNADIDIERYNKRVAENT